MLSRVMTACQVWPQSLLWQFLCFPLRSSSMSVFPETLMTLLQNLLFQPDFLFSSTCSLSFFTFSSSLHRFRFSFKTIHLPRLYEFWKEVRKQSFNDFFKNFSNLPKQCKNLLTFFIQFPNMLTSHETGV